MKKKKDGVEIAPIAQGEINAPDNPRNYDHLCQSKVFCATLKRHRSKR